MKKTFLILACFSVLIGCNTNKRSDGTDVDKITAKEPEEQKELIIDSNIIKVYIDKTGQIAANGNPVSLANLESSFSVLKKHNGIVYYSRDNSQPDPAAEYMKVIDLITRYGLPIKFYMDKTFTRSCKNELFCG
jgi:biopolymer transport protein ExbD